MSVRLPPGGGFCVSVFQGLSVKQSMMEHSKNTKPSRVKIVLVGLLVIASVWAMGAALLGSPKSNPPVADTTPTAPVEENLVDPVAYKIVSQDESSAKAMGGKSLSSYSNSEVSKLPVIKKIVYRVVVSPDIKPEEIRPTAQKIVADIRAGDKDIDEMGIFMYSNESLTGGAWDIASAVWGVGGKFGGITPEIARSNIRTGYDISIKTK